ncbi:MAG: tol-pal system-associated acyl-CoA thioesterase [Burkholderiaceae bacterium]|nr:tol-pal system-associated acyl-CoA thioesterase [Burkholderiaceae bacterium]
MQNDFHLPVRVYYEDTDHGRVVYHSNYLKFFERGRTEFLRALGWNQSQLIESGLCAFVVASMTINYRRPAILDDMLDIRTRVTNLRQASFVFEQKAFRDGVLLCDATVKVACVDPVRGMPMIIPENMFEQIKAVYENGEK